MEIADLNLSVRTFNAVCRADIKTIPELYDMYQCESEKLRLLIGNKYFEEIGDALARHREEVWEENRKADEPTAVTKPAVIVSEDYTKAVNLTRSIIANAQAAQQSLYEVCKGLKEVRDSELFRELGYSNFEDYCNNAVRITYRQAKKYVAIANGFEGSQLPSLGTEKLYLLAKLDEPTREAVTETVDVENTTVKELKAEIDKLKTEKSAVMAEKHNALLALNRSQDETAQAQTELMNAQKEVEQLRQSNAELTEDNNYLIRRCAEAEEDLEEAQNAPIDHAVLEDTESKKELERVRGLMEKMSEGFSQKELAIEERVRKEYEEKLAAAQNGGDGRQVYKFLIENAMQSVARVKSFLKQHPDYAADKEKDFLDLISQNFFTVLEAMQDG